MKKIYTIIFSLIAFSSVMMSEVFSQIPMIVNRDWVRNFSEKDQITNVPSAIDANGNIYVTGYSFIGGTNYNYTTIKYNQQGDTLWIRHYNGTANSADMATAIALDNSGNVYITGKSIGTGTNFDYVTVKYNSAGVQLWAARYNGTGNGYDEATAIAVDNVGNVFVTGYSTGTGTLEDYATVKYNSSGVQQWVQRYNGTGNGYDKATALTINTNNRIIVTGFSTNASGKLDIVTLRYNSGNGLIQWTKIYTGSFNGDDIANSIINDGTSVIICGSTQITANNSDYLILKYNTSNSNQIFSLTYDGYGANDYANSLIIDNTGKFYVTGVCKNNTLVEYHTLEYNNSGVQQWIHKYPLNLSNTNIINKVAIDTWDMIYVCGETKGTSSRDFVLYQLNGNGGQQWVETYNGIANGQDAINDMVVDNSGHIFVTGQTFNGNAKFDFTTIKYSQTPVFFPPDFNNEPAGSLIFNENKGQLVSVNNQLIPEQRFYSTSSSPSLYVSDSKLSYVFSKIDTIDATPDTLHRIDMTFNKGNPNTKAFPFEMKESNSNYFLGHCPQGITNTKGFTRLLIPNIYPNIDLHYYSNSIGLKFYFVVKPGGNPNDISIIYDGATSVSGIALGKLRINSSVGYIDLDKPRIYQVNYSQNIIPVSGNTGWVVGGNNTVSFNTGNHNNVFPLVIQVDLGQNLLSPEYINGNLEWSTYYGGSIWCDFYDVDVDSEGNAYVCGSTYSAGFPVLPGAYHDTHIAYRDLVAVKFDSLGVRQWATEYGGNGHDWEPFGAIDYAGNFFMTARTKSSNLPMSTYVPAYDSTYAAGNSKDDIVIIKLEDAVSPNQQHLLWATYYGGDGDDFPKDIHFDSDSNLYVVGFGDSNTSLRYKNGAYNDSICSGTQKGLIIKFNKNLKRNWATLFGGTFSYINSVVIDSSGNKFITGKTSENYPIVNPGGNAYVDSTSGYNQYNTRDAYIAKFNNNDSLVWSTYLAGEYVDEGHCLATDGANIYLCGQTPSQDFPLSYNPGGPAYYDNWIGVGMEEYHDDGFIFEFSNSGEPIWSTLFGGSSADRAFTLTVDDGIIYVAGFTYSPDLDIHEIPDTYYQSTSDETNGNAFICAFNKETKAKVWATYFGGDNFDIPGTIATYKSKKLYAVGSTHSLTNTFPLKKLTSSDWYDDIKTNSSFPSAFLSRFDLASVWAMDVKETKPVAFNNLVVYPNPASNQVTVQFETEEKQNIVIEIYNSIGQLFYKENLNGQVGKTEKQINISKFSNGLYIINVVFPKKSFSKKIIKN